MDKLTYEKLLEKINSRKAVTFSRFGDGEWNAIFGKTGSNCDGHEYFESLGAALRNVLLSKPDYYLGLQGLAMRVMGDRITEFVVKHNIRPIEDWSDADILHKASIKGLLHEFFKAINNAPYVILVAPDYIKRIDKYFKYDVIINVSTKNCWLEYKIIERSVAESIDKQIKQDKHVIVLFIASMSSNVLIDTLYNRYRNKVSLIDAGSVLDPFVGKKTRSYHQKLDIKG